VSEVVRRYWEAQDPYDADAMAAVRHPGWIAEWPQTGERIPSHEADTAIHTNYPGYPEHHLGRMTGRDEEWAMTPMLTPVRISGAGDLWVGEARLVYPDEGPMHAVAILELEDGLIRRETVWWMPPFEAPGWRRGWVTTGADQPTEVGVSLSASPEHQAHHRAAIARYLEAMGGGAETADRAEEAIRALYREDAVEIFPQSGERVNGLETMLAILEHHPTRPVAAARRILVLGDLAAYEAELDYGGERWFQVAIAEFEGERIRRVTQYFGPTFETPAWRSQWVERI
jgi:hypothetical protein